MAQVVKLDGRDGCPPTPPRDHFLLILSVMRSLSSIVLYNFTAKERLAAPSGAAYRRRDAQTADCVAPSLFMISRPYQGYTVPMS